jgi:hypothetical protein
MRIDPADLAESIGTLADLDPDRGLTRGLDRVVAAATTLFGADTAGLMLLAKDGTLTREIIDSVWPSSNNHRPDKPGRGNKAAQEH